MRWTWPLCFDILTFPVFLLLVADWNSEFLAGGSGTDYGLRFIPKRLLISPFLDFSLSLSDSTRTQRLCREPIPFFGRALSALTLPLYSPCIVSEVDWGAGKPGQIGR